MGKFEIGNGQYVIYAKDQQEVIQVINKEIQRFEYIKSKMASLLSQDGKAIQNFLENTSEENLNIHFNDETSLIYDEPDNATIKGEVRQRNVENGKYTYDLAYRYPDIQGQNANFRLAHEMGHLMLNPSNTDRLIYNKETDSRHVSGLIRRTEDGQYYGTQIQENAINLIAQLAIRGEHSADAIIKGKVDVSEFNSYKRCDDLIKLLVVSMRNDFNKEINLEQLVEQKIDSFIEHSDGTKEPANTFFYGILNDSSMIENEFDKYMGNGAWKDLDTAFKQLHQPNITKERFDNIYQKAQALITEFANVRMQEKYKEAVARNGNSIPSLDNKINMINEMTGLEQRQQQNHNIQTNNNQLSLKQKMAQLLRRSDMLMNVPFIEKFVNRQLNVLPSNLQGRSSAVNSSKGSFLKWLSNNGEYRNLPPIRRLSDQERMAQMQRRMQQKQQKDAKGRG